MILHRWFVVAAAHVTAILTLGFLFSFGNLFADIMRTFNATRAYAGSVQSVAIAFGLSTGVLNGLLIQRFGLLKVSILCAVFVSFGPAVCLFANSMLFLIIFISLVMGSGITGLIITSSMAVEQYFSDKLCPMVLSFVAVGSGTGGFVIPYLLRYLADEFGLRGTFLIMGGIIMNVIPLSLFFRATPTTKPLTQDKPANCIKSTDKTEQADKECSKGNCKIAEAPEDVKKETRSSKLPETSTVNQKVLHVSDTQTNEHCINSEELESARITENTNVDSKSLIPSQKDKYLNENSKATFDEKQNIGGNRPTALQKANLKDKEDTPDGHLFYATVSLVIRNPAFILYCFAVPLSYQAVVVLVIFFQDILLDAGFSIDNASLAIFILNLVSTFGRIAPGLLFQFSCVSTFTVPIIAAVSVIISLVGTMLVHTLVPKMFFFSFAGIALGMYVSMHAVMAIRFFNRSSMSIAMGFIMTFNGLTIGGIGPFSGWLRDHTGTYQTPFITSTSAAAFALVLMVIGHFCRQRTKNTSKDMVELTVTKL